MSESPSSPTRKSGQPSLLFVGVAVLVIVAFLTLLGVGMMNREPRTASSGVVRVGKLAPDFELALFDGDSVRLSDLRGKGVVVNFWASWCVPCRAEMPALNEAYASTSRDDIIFIGVNFWSITETESSARAFAAEFEVQYPVGRDADGGISLDYGVTGLPATFFIDPEGLVARRWVGALDLERLESLVSEITPSA